MKDIKIAHEAPLSLMPLVKRMTDYDYALVHLFDRHEMGTQYFYYFQDSLQEGREVILDNSLYELKEAFDSEKFARYIEFLSPTYYVIPDAWHDAQKTVSNAQIWHDSYGRKLPSKSIGVVQGETFDDFMECCRAMIGLCDMIAISFSYPFYSDLSWNESWTRDKLYMQSTGRPQLLRMLAKEEWFDKEKPIHLLGCSLPQEFTIYKTCSLNIHSVDTSNPVACGMERIRYKNRGVDSKPASLMADLLDAKADIDQTCDIAYNIARFREFINQ